MPCNLFGSGLGACFHCYWYIIIVGLGQQSRSGYRASRADCGEPGGHDSQGITLVWQKFRGGGCKICRYGWAAVQLRFRVVTHWIPRWLCELPTSGLTLRTIFSQRLSLHFVLLQEIPSYYVLNWVDFEVDGTIASICTGTVFSDSDVQYMDVFVPWYVEDDAWASTLGYEFDNYRNCEIFRHSREISVGR